jgi:hypothetical protein
MPYIDKDYYLTTFLGTDPKDDAVLNKSIMRSNDMIDLISNYIMVNTKLHEYIDFTTLDPWKQDLIRKATATLTEHFILQGGYDSAKQMKMVQSASVGSFSVGNSNIEYVPDDVFFYLGQSGILHQNLRLRSGLY